MEKSNLERYTIFGVPIIRLFLIVITIVIVMSIMLYFSSIVAYILIAWVISLLGEPLMHFLLYKLNWVRFRYGRMASAIITLISFISIIVLLGFIFIPTILSQAYSLSSINPNTIIQSLEEPISNIHQFLIQYNMVDPAITTEEIGRQLIKDYVSFNQFSYLLGSIISSAGNIFIGTFSVLFIAFFFLKEEKLFKNLMIALVPTNKESGVNNAVNDISSLLTRYFGGMFINILTFSLLAFVGLYIIGVPNAALLGFFGGLTNTIPYVGPLIGALFGIVMTLTSNVEMSFYTELLPLLIKVALVFWGCQIVDNVLLQPLVYGKSVKAHPLEIFIIVLVGAKIGGILGMFLAIPVYTVIRVIAMTFFSEFKLVQKITNSIKKTEEHPR